MNHIDEQLRMAARGKINAGPAVPQILPKLERRGVERGTVALVRHPVERGRAALVVANGGSGEAELARCGARSLRLPVPGRNPLTIRADIRRLQYATRDRNVRRVPARTSGSN